MPRESDGAQALSRGYSTRADETCTPASPNQPEDEHEMWDTTVRSHGRNMSLSVHVALKRSARKFA